MSILALSPEFGLEQSINFRTDIFEAETGIEQRAALWDVGLRSYSLSVQFLTQTDMNTIWDFYIARKGAYEAFWVKIPTEFQVSYESIGTGDGKTVAFLLDEFPVDVSDNYTIYATGESVAGTMSNNTATEKSYFTFSIAPGVGKALHADYEFYFNVRFAEDNMTRKLMAYQLLNADLKLVEVRWPEGYHPRAGNI